MSLRVGERIGCFEILGSLGAGGMGEVYRARDTKLNRDVAIKVLPDSFANDPDRLGRFEREAQVLASLNHPNIAHIHGLEESAATGSGQRAIGALVMELVDGDDLSMLIARGPMPLADALPIAKQIADALEAAHEQGIIHRDLKPANVKVRADGAVKVLDFGLAKALDPSAASGAEAMNSPTLSVRATQMGVIIGTAAYMAPEQARGKAVDRRADIWAFGVVLYEMLSGARAFKGEDISITLASVLKDDANWQALPSDLPEPIRKLLRRCLEKDPKRRLRDIGEARLTLEDPASSEPPTREPVAASAVPLAPQSLWRRAMPIAVTAVTVSAAAALAGYAAWTWKPEPPRIVGRFSITTPEGQIFTNTARRFIDVSPDGTRVAYLAGNRLYVRELSTLESHAIAGDGAQVLSNPTFSPDSQWLAYVLASPTGNQIKRVAVSGGAPVTICDADSMFGVSWSQHGILFGQGAKGILRVAPEGGTPEVVAAAASEEVLGSPTFLPGGRAILFAAKKSPEGWDKGQILAQRLDGGERKVLVTQGQDGRYLETGHLVYVLGGVLLAQRFDPSKLVLSGGPVPVVEGVRRAVNSGSSGSAQMSVSRSGTLVFAPGQVTTEAPTGDLAFFDRKGASQALKLSAGTYRAPRVSRDGKFVSFESEDAKEAIVWVYELSGARAMQRLTFTGNNRAPMWSPDGQWIAFQSDREGDVAIYRQRADGSGVAERLTRPDPGSEHIPQDWSLNGTHVLFTIRKEQVFTLATMTLDDRKTAVVPGVQSPALINAMFSPDGRWIAYQSRVDNRAGALAPNAVFVEPFPSTGAKYLLPARGGHPTWSPKGDEILVNSAPQQSTIVSVTTKPTFGFGQPADFPRTARAEPNPGTDRRNVDFMPDGQRLMGVLVPGAATGVVNNEFVVILNWTEELRARVPTR